MRIGTSSTGYFKAVPVAGDFARMKRHGYDCVDFQSFGDTENELFTCSNKEFEQKLKTIRASAEESGIEVFQAHGPWHSPLQDATEQDRTKRFEEMAKALYGSALLGCKYLVIHPLMPFGWQSDPEPEKLWEINLRYFTLLTREAQNCGTVLCLENTPMTALSLARPVEILNLVREIDSPYMRVCLDTGHCAVFGQPSDAVRLLGKEYLSTLHVPDNNGREDLHWLPYTGVTDWGAFCHALRDIGFDGVMSIEASVKGTYPPNVRDYLEIGVAMMAKSLAEESERVL